MAEQQINVAQQDTLEAIGNKIDTLDTVADNIYAKVDTEIATISAGLEEVKKSVSDGKLAVATAITNKGVTTAADADFATMASNIGSITTINDVTQRGATTWTPSTANQNIPAGTYLTGAQTILGDADLKSENIKAGANIFGITGNSNVVDTSAGTATAAQILSGKKAYVDGKLITGTMPNNSGATVGWSGYETITVQPHPQDSSQGLITISNQYGSKGYFDNSSKITGNMANLNAGNIKAGVAVGQVNGNSSNSIVGTFTSDANATASQILSGKTAYVNGAKITGTIPSQGAQTITPGTSNKTISAGKYLSGTQTIKGDADLIASNIKNGVEIFGVTGNVKPADPFTLAEVTNIKHVAMDLQTYYNTYGIWSGTIPTTTVTDGSYIGYRFRNQYARFKLPPDCNILLKVDIRACAGKNTSQLTFTNLNIYTFSWSYSYDTLGVGTATYGGTTNSRAYYSYHRILTGTSSSAAGTIIGDDGDTNNDKFTGLDKAKNANAIMLGQFNCPSNNNLCYYHVSYIDLYYV